MASESSLRFHESSICSVCLVEFTETNTGVPLTANLSQVTHVSGEVCSDCYQLARNFFDFLVMAQSSENIRKTFLSSNYSYKQWRESHWLCRTCMKTLTENTGEVDLRSNPKFLGFLTEGLGDLKDMVLVDEEVLTASDQQYYVCQPCFCELVASMKFREFFVVPKYAEVAVKDEPDDSEIENIELDSPIDPQEMPTSAIANELNDSPMHSDGCETVSTSKILSQDEVEETEMAAASEEPVSIGPQGESNEPDQSDCVNEAIEQNDVPFESEESESSDPKEDSDVSYQMEEESAEKSSEGGGKPEKCPTCHKGFYTVANLRYHIRTVHENRRPHKCNFCEKSFSLPSGRKRHELIHIRQWPEECEHCLKKFPDKYALKNHMNAVHLKEMPYKCQYCPAAFGWISSRMFHERIHLKKGEIKMQTISLESPPTVCESDSD